VNKDSGSQAKRHCAQYDTVDNDKNGSSPRKEAGSAGVGPDQRGKKEVAGVFDGQEQHQRAPPTLEEDESSMGDMDRLRESNGAGAPEHGAPHTDMEQRMIEEKEFIRLNDTATCEVWYLVDVNWLQSWKSFVTKNGSLPGPIDNGRLVDTRTGLPWRGLKPVDDYRGVNQAIWTYWHQRYGGGPTVKRQYLDLYTGHLDEEADIRTRQSQQHQHELSLPGAAASGAEAGPTAGGSNRAESNRNQSSRRQRPLDPEPPEERSQGSSSSGSRSGPEQQVSTTTPRRSHGVETLTASVRSRLPLGGSSRGGTSMRSVNKGAGGGGQPGGGSGAAVGFAGSDDQEVDTKPAKALCCDKCDGPHETDKCPHFRKAREKHADAWSAYGKTRAGRGNDGDGAPIIRTDRVRVVAQPGDGSCLFHSLSYGLSDSSDASALRSEICRYIAKNPDLTIADTSIKDWVRYDSESNESVAAYARRMEGGSWGGAIEMAALMSMKRVNVHVYERCREGYRRISAFELDGARKTVNVLYQGRNHYDALVV
jgi:hypothetical protein